jgi:hypothetical protein
VCKVINTCRSLTWHYQSNTTMQTRVEKLFARFNYRPFCWIILGSYLQIRITKFCYKSYLLFNCMFHIFIISKFCHSDWNFNNILDQCNKKLKVKLSLCISITTPQNICATQS